MISCLGINCSANSVPTTSTKGTTTDPSEWASAWGWIVYMDFLYSYMYFLVIVSPAGLILNFLTLAVILLSKNWSNPAKDHYLNNAGMNIFLSISIDILVTMLRGIETYLSLNNNGNLSVNLQVDNLNVIVCVGHNYINPVLEFIWMWNAVNFSLKRCLVICFPFRVLLISKLMNWRLMAAQVAFGSSLWWVNLIYYRFWCFSIYSGTYCTCYNSSLNLNSWQIFYTLI